MTGRRNMAREPDKRLSHVMKIKPEATPFSQILLNSLGQGDARAHSLLPGQGSATAANAV